MENKYVFLDTEIFVQQNFQYDIGLLAAFRHKVISGQLDLITTEITLDEIRKRIDISLKEAENALNTFRTKARILRNIQSPQIVRVFKKLSRKKLLHELLSQFDNYIDELKPTILKSDSVTPSTVFTQYFKSLPPFHQDKKKSEFPDAFAIETLKLFCNSNNCKVTIVTADPDWRDVAIENKHIFEYEERLDQLLHNIQEDTPLIEKAQSTLETLNTKIETMFKDEFLNLEFFVADREAMIQGIEVNNIRNRQSYLVDVRPDTIIFSVDVDVGFSAIVDYPTRQRKSDPSYNIASAVWKHSFSEYFPPKELYGYESFSVIVTIDWDANDFEKAVVKEININNPRNVPLYFEDYYGS